MSDKENLIWINEGDAKLCLDYLDFALQSETPEGKYAEEEREEKQRVEKVVTSIRKQLQVKKTLKAKEGN